MSGTSRDRKNQKENGRIARLQRSRLEETLVSVNVEQDALKREVLRRERLEYELRTSVANLKRVNDELDSFAHALSHDLKAPLRRCASLLMFLEQDQQPPLNEAAQQHLDNAVSMTDRMSSMINGVLEYARARGAVEGKRVPLARVAEVVIDNLGLAIAEAGASIEVGVLPVVMGHEVRLVQLLQNLIQNAVRYRAERPLVVKVSAKEVGGRWCITVEDNGEGMEAHRKADSFVLFRRLSNESEGIGVGLALCKQIVEAHGGTIEVESEVGVGSCFSFTLERAT